MNLIKLPFLLTLLLICVSFKAQVIKNSVSNINIMAPDSVKVNNRSPLSLLMVNYQTGEATFKVESESFTTSDSTLKRFFFQKNNDIELHFNITKNMLDMLTTDNKEHSAETPGMLYINNHFHSVSINYSLYNKNGNTIDFANNNVFFSFQLNFRPEDFQLDWLSSYTREPVLIWSNKQPMNFSNTN